MSICLLSCSHTLFCWWQQCPLAVLAALVTLDKLWLGLVSVQLSDTRNSGQKSGLRQLISKCKGKKELVLENN